MARNNMPMLFKKRSNARAAGACRSPRRERARPLVFAFRARCFFHLHEKNMRNEKRCFLNAVFSEKNAGARQVRRCARACLPPAPCPAAWPDMPPGGGRPGRAMQGAHAPTPLQPDLRVLRGETWVPRRQRWPDLRARGGRPPQGNRDFLPPSRPISTRGAGPRRDRFRSGTAGSPLSGRALKPTPRSSLQLAGSTRAGRARTPGRPEWR